MVVRDEEQDLARPVRQQRQVGAELVERRIAPCRGSAAALAGWDCRAGRMQMSCHTGRIVLAVRRHEAGVAVAAVHLPLDADQNAELLAGFLHGEQVEQLTIAAPSVAVVHPLGEWPRRQPFVSVAGDAVAHVEPDQHHARSRMRCDEHRQQARPLVDGGVVHREIGEPGAKLRIENLGPQQSAGGRAEDRAVELRRACQRRK